jgi:XTP/dITP diphosphohydrolase
MSLPARIVLASHNPGKLAELRELLAGLPVRWIPAAELGLAEPAETGLSFVENALIKARAACVATGLPALADDSGLCVDALDGAPGLHTAHYAGYKAGAAANIAKLLDALATLPDAKRTARFVAVVVLLRHAADPHPLIAEGVWEGRIASAPRGAGGFGYDPVFLDAASGQSAAEMPSALKHALSHRGRALAQLRTRLEHGAQRG